MKIFKLSPLLVALMPIIANANEIWLEEFNGAIVAGIPQGLTYENTPTGQGARFTRASESRVQYPYSSGMPRSGTMELRLKVDSAYQYRNYALSTTESCALVFTTDVGGGDVTYPGSAWFHVCNNGDISLTVSTTKYGSSPAQSLVAKATAFRFGEWHTVSFSFGVGGQAISVNGAVVAENSQNIQQLDAGGTHSSPIDTPTLGESKPGFWANNQWDGGFEGVVDTFRVSDASRDWKLYGAKTIKKGVSSNTDICPTHLDWCAHPTFEVLGTVSQSDIPINLINASYIVDELTRTNDNSRATFTANLYNRGYADAMLDIYDRQGNWTGFIPLDGNRPETTIVGDIWNHWTTIYDSLNDDYSTLDPRDAAGVAELAVRFSIPRGGYAKLSKNSTSALANTLLNNALDVFGEREWIKQQGKTNKMKLLKIFINEAINEGIGELISLLQDAFNRNDAAEAETIKQQILTKAFSISYSVFVNNTDVVARAIGNNKAKRFAKKAIKFFAPLSTAIEAVETDALILSITGQWVDIARASDPRNDKTVYFK